MFLGCPNLTWILTFSTIMWRQRYVYCTSLIYYGIIHIIITCCGIICIIIACCGIIYIISTCCGLSVIVIICVSLEALFALILAYNATGVFTFPSFLSFAFCSTFSLFSFNILFLSIFITYTFVVLPFLVFTIFALFLCSLVSFL